MNSSGDSANKGKTNQNIQVYVRVRPTNTREKLIRSNEIVEVQGARDVVAKQVLDSRTTKRFTFDRAFGMDSQQHEVYASVVSPMIDEVLAGYNCTVFAYGQTGTGKTYTMVGEEQPTLSSTQEDASNVGIIPRALNHLFDDLRLMEVEFAMRVSYLELYNEELCDLLSTDDSVKIRIFDDVSKKGSVIVQGLEEIPVRCKSDVYKLLAKGQERRKTAATLMNAQSSRSHTVFSILVHIKENGNDGEEMLKIGKLNLVDLAGSENISKAGNEKGIRTRESVNINQSLLTLGRVITALVERTPHIPYRESKLTRLLQESLGGRTKTSIIATVSPGHKDLEETLSTLDYAHRAKNIQNKPEINQRLTKKVVLKEYTEEIDRLKRDLMAAREKNGIYLASDTYNDMLYKMEIQQKELNEKITLMKTLKEDLFERNRRFEECSKNLEEVSSRLMNERSKVRITEAELSKTKRNLRKVERHHEEKKHIVMCQQKTEEALTEHAKQLIKVADEASGDTYGLLESINRRKQVEDSAVTQSDQLLKNLSNNIIEMRHDMEQLKTKHKESTKLVVGDLDENTKMNKQFTSSLLGGLKTLRDLRETSSTQIINIVSEWTKSTGEASDSDAKKFVLWMCQMEQQQLSFYSSVGEKIQAMEALLLKEKEESKGMRAQLLEKVNQQNASIENFCGELKNKIEQHSREFTSLSLQNKKNSDEQKLKLQEVKRLLKEVEELDCSLIQEEMNKINSNLLETGSDNIKVFSEQNSLILGEKIGCLKNVEDSQAEMCAKLSENLLSAADVVQKENEKTKADLQKQIQLIEEEKARFLVQLSTVENAVSDQVKQTSAVEGQKCDEITDLMKTENSRVLVKAQEVKSLVQHTLTGHVKSAESNVCEKLLKSSDNIEQFQQQDLLKYKSTGETPARKDFKFNKNLVATSPHDRIIKRLRMETGLSDSSHQLGTSLLEENEPDANSTPLRLHDVSNVSDVVTSKCLKDIDISNVSEISEEKENQQFIEEV